MAFLGLVDGPAVGVVTYSGRCLGVCGSGGRVGFGVLATVTAFLLGVGDPADLFAGQSDLPADALTRHIASDQRGDLAVSFDAEGFDLPVAAHD